MKIIHYCVAPIAKANSKLTNMPSFILYRPYNFSTI